MQSPKSDPQRQEVYRWERGFAQLFYDHEMKPRAMHRMAREMAGAYGVRKPRMRRSRSRESYVAAAIGAEEIHINKDKAHYTAIVVAHEMAHIITHAYGVLEAPHGPTWLAVYLWLLDRFSIVPKTATVPSARRAGLKFKSLDSVAPGVL